jgi:hypothetical protein
MAAVTATVVAGAASAYGANRAAKAQQGAANSAMGEQRRQFDLARQDQAPWLQAGTNALARLEAVNNGDYSGFMSSPDYLAALQQGTEAQNRAAAAVGNVSSGGTSADLVRFGQQLATQNLGNYTNRLMGLAGVGQSSAQNLGSLGANSANQIGQYQLGAGQARASGYQQQAGAFASGIGALGGIYAGYGKKPGGI